VGDTRLLPVDLVGRSGVVYGISTPRNHQLSHQVCAPFGFAMQYVKCAHTEPFAFRSGAGEGDMRSENGVTVYDSARVGLRACLLQLVAGGPFPVPSPPPAHSPLLFQLSSSSVRACNVHGAILCCLAVVAPPPMSLLPLPLSLSLSLSLSHARVLSHTSVIALSLPWCAPFAPAPSPLSSSLTYCITHPSTHV